MQGKSIRTSKIWGRDGKAMLVAADHGLMLGPIKGVENLEATLTKIIQGGTDGILVSPGQAQHIHHLFHGKNAPAMLMRGDYNSGFRTSAHALANERYHEFKMIPPQKALALGASAMVVYYILGRPEDPTNDEATNIRNISQMAEESEACGLPFIIEPMPIGPRATSMNQTDLLKIGIRVAEEIGADGIKIQYSGDTQSFKEMVSSIDIPVFILGGPRSDTDRAACELVQNAMNAGARGTVFGRQLLQADDPMKLARYLSQIVHGTATVEALFSDQESIKAKPKKTTRVK